MLAVLVRYFLLPSPPYSLAAVDNGWHRSFVNHATRFPKAPVKPRAPYGPRRVDLWRAAFDRGGGVSKEQAMTDHNELDAGATPHDLLNLATEWLQYSKGMTELLAELVHESDKLNPQQMAMGLEAACVG